MSESIAFAQSILYIYFFSNCLYAKDQWNQFRFLDLNFKFRSKKFLKKKIIYLISVVSFKQNWMISYYIRLRRRSQKAIFKAFNFTASLETWADLENHLSEWQLLYLWLALKKKTEWSQKTIFLAFNFTSSLDIWAELENHLLEWQLFYLWSVLNNNLALHLSKEKITYWSDKYSISY